MARQVGRTVIHFKCAHCGADGQRFKGQPTGNSLFCNQACYLASDHHAQTVRLANRARSPRAKETRPCANGCGVQVTRYVSRGTKNFLCSEGCKLAWQRRGDPQLIPASGYVRVFIGYGAPGATKSGHILEHRKVMQELLGRPLTGDENVHHLNGVRSDNRPENLELWSSSQPSGQRVEDKVEWAREFLAFYEKELPVIVHRESWWSDAEAS